MSVGAAFLIGDADLDRDEYVMTLGEADRVLTLSSRVGGYTTVPWTT